MGTDRRRAKDFLWVSHTTPTAERALNLIAREPGLTVADLRDRLGVSMGRTWQVLNILQQPASSADARHHRTGPVGELLRNDLMDPLVGHTRQPRDLPHRQPSPMRRPDRLVSLLSQPLPIRVNPSELIGQLHQPGPNRLIARCHRGRS